MFRRMGKNIVSQIVTAGARGFYSSKHCGIRDGEIAEFAPQDKSGCMLKPFGKPAKLRKFDNGAVVADFRDADGYLHSLEKSYASRWSFGFIVVPNVHTEDQFLLSAGAFEIRLPAQSPELVFSYGGRYEIRAPIRYDSGVVVFCGYPGSCLRVFVNGEKMPDVKTQTVVGPKTRAVICADGRGKRPWRGLLADMVIYDRYEPAENKNLPAAWEEYAYETYSL